MEAYFSVDQGLPLNSTFTLVEKQEENVGLFISAVLSADYKKIVFFKIFFIL